MISPQKNKYRLSKRNMAFFLRNSCGLVKYHDVILLYPNFQSNGKNTSEFFEGMPDASERSIRIKADILVWCCFVGERMFKELLPGLAPETRACQWVNPQSIHFYPREPIFDLRNFEIVNQSVSRQDPEENCYPMRFTIVPWMRRTGNLTQCSFKRFFHGLRRLERGESMWIWESLDLQSHVVQAPEFSLSRCLSCFTRGHWNRSHWEGSDYPGEKLGSSWGGFLLWIEQPTRKKRKGMKTGPEEDIVQDALPFWGILWRTEEPERLTICESICLFYLLIDLKEQVSKHMSHIQNDLQTCQKFKRLAFFLCVCFLLLHFISIPEASQFGAGHLLQLRSSP